MKQRPTICAPYRQYEVCGMGLPSSGALTIGQILGILSSFDLSAMGDSLNSRRLIGDASRLAFADRGRYMADPDFVQAPHGLLDPSYLAKRAELLKTQSALPNVTAGKPPGIKVSQTIPLSETIELPSTTHVSIIDAEGNALSMTSSIENAFWFRLNGSWFSTQQSINRLFVSSKK